MRQPAWTSAPRARQPSSARRQRPAADLRALARGDAGAVARLQRSVGNAGVMRLLARCGAGRGPCGCGCPEAEPDEVAAQRVLARQPVPAWDDYQPPQTGPGQPKMPDVSGCSLVWKDGRLHWKCENIGPITTPEIPLDPRRIPGELEKLLPKKPPQDPGWTPGQRPPLGPGLQPPDLGDVCRLNPSSLLCQLVKPPAIPGQKPPGGSPPTTPPVGTFYSFDVGFEHDRPATGASAAGAMTSDGAATLQSVIAMLKADPTLQVRLTGHASAEGGDADNLALSTRRAQAVNAALKAEGLGARVMDYVGADAPAGCTKLEFGVWACGEAHAAQGAANPADRKVSVLFLRNAPIGAGGLDLKLTPPFGGDAARSGGRR